MNAAPNNLQPLLQRQPRLPVSVEHGQNEVGSVTVSSEIHLRKWCHVVHLIKRNSILLIVAGKQYVALVWSLAKCRSQLHIEQVSNILSYTHPFITQILEFVYLIPDEIRGAMSTQLHIIIQFVQLQVSLNVLIEVCAISRDSSTNEQFVTVQFHNL